MDRASIVVSLAAIVRLHEGDRSPEVNALLDQAGSLAAELAGNPPPSHDLLSQLRSAWGDKLIAEVQLARLRKYERKTRAMKDDEDRWLRLARESDATLSRVLGGAR